MQVHYLEFVCADVVAQCAALEAAQGLSFGPPNPDLGHARVAVGEGGTRVGVRAPLADHEQPVIRPYFAVDDIVQAVAKVEAEGATVAYPPTRQGDTGTWAIYLVGDLQIGLWQG
jgi:predicted enzyme related to lactoylglutathione lyase